MKKHINILSYSVFLFLLLGICSPLSVVYAEDSSPTYSMQFNPYHTIDGEHTAQVIAGKFEKNVDDSISIDSINETKELDLSNKELTQIDGIEIFSNLITLNCSSNKLRGLPESIGYLKDLENLDLSSNEIVDFPTSLEKLKKLKCLNLTQNKLTNISDSITSLNQLTNLYLSNNEISSLPEDFGCLTNLQALTLSSKETLINFTEL